ncbi:MAG: response regulator transcription factor [Syntrophobacteraceae bacterium]|jgi:DNA-binding NarL/FixJ family response regulator|nr:response regulator transcription factor [Syntrophobacteraceae bacterium]
MELTILLADDHKIVRDGLRALLEKETDMEVIAEAEDGESAVRLVGELNPSVVVMDIGMPDMNGIEATRQIVGSHPGVKVIALSMHSDKRFVGGMLKAGAAGYLLKDCAFGELANAIRAVTQGQTYLSAQITHVVVQGYVRQAAPSAPAGADVLTGREREVLQLLAEGKSTKDIAAVLRLSARTVETHRQQIMNKLNIHKAAELVKYAIREGVITLDDH